MAVQHGGKEDIYCYFQVITYLGISYSISVKSVQLDATEFNTLHLKFWLCIVYIIHFSLSVHFYLNMLTLHPKQSLVGLTAAVRWDDFGKVPKILWDTMRERLCRVRGIITHCWDRRDNTQTAVILLSTVPRAKQTQQIQFTVNMLHDWNKTQKHKNNMTHIQYIWNNIETFKLSSPWRQSLQGCVFYDLSLVLFDQYQAVLG